MRVAAKIIQLSWLNILSFPRLPLAKLWKYAGCNGEPAIIIRYFTLIRLIIIYRIEFILQNRRDYNNIYVHHTYAVQLRFHTSRGSNPAGVADQAGDVVLDDSY